MTESLPAPAVPQGFQPPAPLRSPVLLLIFNRPAVTAQVFGTIRTARPPRLYVAADGPRPDRAGEAEKCRLARQIVDRIDWPCELHTLFRDENLGCKRAVSEAISWFFANEERGIILEDDCLPVQSFFWYCEALLEHYANDERIGHISGTRFFADPSVPASAGGGSYGYSRYGLVWGWASWRRAWQYYDADLKHWQDMTQPRWWKAAYAGRAERRCMKAIGRQLNTRMLDTWDYQWSFARTFRSQLSVSPQVNLIVNLGFCADATHTTYQHPDAPTSAADIALPLVHPPFLLPDTALDDRYASVTFGRVRSRLRLLFARLRDPNYLNRLFNRA